MLPRRRQERPVNWRYHVNKALSWACRPVSLAVVRTHVRLFAIRVGAERRRYGQLSHTGVRARLIAQRGHVKVDSMLAPETVTVVALAAELAHRVLGIDPFPAQIRGAGVLLSGRLAEMETGSGKTLTAALAAIAASYAGLTVHVVTANDYLAERDVTELGPLYEAAGLSTGLIVNRIPQTDRQRAYAADIVYASNKEIAFDYLRSRTALGGASGAVRLALEPLHVPLSRWDGVPMRGLAFAIVDEADSVLIDECRTPLIISTDAEPDPEAARTALELGDALSLGTDYEVDDRQRRVTLTGRGRRRLKALGEDLGGVWRNNTRREAAARQGISARRYFLRDEHYIVRDGRVELIDEYTGRVASDRALGDGLHQVIQSKEGVEITGRRFTKGRITYQRFFRRYARLAGMTGTAAEVSSELSAVYGLGVVPLAPHRRSRRRRLRTHIVRLEAQKWQKVAQRTAKMLAKGRPVLIATRTVKASEEAAAALDAAGIDHLVLNATQDAEEGAVIAAAGQAGRVTVATNMAGRGVDIRLGAGVAAAGGLHVILTEYHEARRIDRQVIGRAGRQGDPGSYETVLSWEDPIAGVFGDWRSRLRLGGVAAFRRAQALAERLHARARLDLLRLDQRREDQLTFTGSTE